MDIQILVETGRSTVKYKCVHSASGPYQIGHPPSSTTRPDVYLSCMSTILKWLDPRIKYQKCWNSSRQKSRWISQHQSIDFLVVIIEN
eukprot:1579325-Amphidinium_carterae.1